jgi:PAS domain-containing protein
MSYPHAIELTQKDRSRSLFLASGFVVFACITLLAMGAWHEWSARSVDLRNAEVEMANLAKSLIQHADDTFEITDTILTGLVGELEENGTSPESLARVQKFLLLRKSVSRVKGLFIYDRDGSWLATTENVDRSKFNNSDRDYFQTHARSASRELLIGKPVRSKSVGEWIVTVSRRFDRPDGSFGGVALATIETGYFSRFYAEFDTGPHGAISLLSRDGVLFARSKDPDAYVARDLSDSPWFTTERKDTAIYHFTSPLDGRERLSVYQRSKRYPLLIFATKAKEDVLASWRGEAASRLTVLLVIVSLLGLAGKKLVQYLAERARMVEALKGKEADFRLLAEESSDMVMRIDAEGVVQYVSPSCARLIGWTVAQIEGTSALGNINPSDLARVERAISSIAKAMRFGLRRR